MTEPIPAQKAPYQVSVQVGRKYFWCACGRSKRQPFCDNSHAGTGIEPIEFIAQEAKDVWFCGCKASARKPLCDGTHTRL